MRNFPLIIIGFFVAFQSFGVNTLPISEDLAQALQLTCIAYDDFTIYDLRKLHNEDRDYIYDVKGFSADGQV